MKTIPQIRHDQQPQGRAASGVVHQSMTTSSGTAGITPFAAPRSNRSRSASRPGSPMSTVSSLTYMPTNFLPSSLSSPRPNVSA